MTDEIVGKIAGILTSARDNIRASMESKGVNASGRTSASLQVVQRGDSIMLIKAAGNNAPMQTLQTGRAGGKVPAGFYDIIKQWSRDKGLSFANERERNTFAYFTARKIAREGTARHKEPIEVYDTIVDDAVEEIRSVSRSYVLGELNTIVSRNI